jgi:hypothetical protein
MLFKMDSLGISVECTVGISEADQELCGYNGLMISDCDGRTRK